MATNSVAHNLIKLVSVWSVKRSHAVGDFMQDASAEVQYLRSLQSMEHIVAHPLVRRISTLTATTYSSAIENKRDYKPKHLKADVHTDNKVQVNYYVAWRIVLDKVNGTDIESFQKLPAYIQAINDSNPGSLTVLNVLAEKFYSLFVSYTSSIEGIKYCRPLIALDGTHLMSKYQGVLTDGGRS